MPSRALSPKWPPTATFLRGPKTFRCATAPRIASFASSPLSTSLTPNIHRSQNKRKVEAYVSYIQIFSKLQTKPTNY